MDKIRPSPSPPPPTSSTTITAPDTKRNEELSVMSRMKKDCLFFTVSLKESFSYIKAIFVGQAKKMTARSEKEAAAAELQAEKMQVEAANEAENVKNKIDKSM
ncbi:unnamed protein product [Dovyalis caffra]|uniref:Uncharacterized protein n=1 Tax=Dovyalis caffra TaxID=77055 RepID=A0AAV1S7N6_9ROSI|nr:unnamed protein product [Dovyalis caffra]